jgi:hypothetical protein
MVDTQLYSTPYLGQVATRGRYPEAQFSSGTAQQIMSRIVHFARAPMVGAKFLYLNTYGAQPPSSAPATGGVMTVRASVEYPIGTFTRITFGGNASATIADNDQALSDPLSVTIPDGALFREWCWASNSAGVLWSHTSQNVDATAYGATAPDYTAAGGTSGMSGQNACYGATAIIGMTDKPSVFILGDSRQSGLGTYLAYGSNDVGNIPRPVSGSYGYINCAVSGAPLWHFYYSAGSVARFKPLSAYCSHIVIGGGINDITGGDTAAALKTSIETLISTYNPQGDKPVFICTTEPKTTSSDSWATVANQSIADSTKEGYRLTHNENVRSGNIVGAWGYFDLAKPVEDAATGKWLAPNYTGDGLHAGPKGELAQMTAVNPSYFGTKGYAAPLS